MMGRCYELTTVIPTTKTVTTIVAIFIIDWESNIGTPSNEPTDATPPPTYKDYRVIGAELIGKQ